MQIGKIHLVWESEQSHLFSNPSYTEEERDSFAQILKHSEKWPAHIWLATSGSIVQKWVGLSKKAFLASAQAVNIHLKSNEKDVWVNALPYFHVGGLSIWARAYLSGAQVCDFKEIQAAKWSAEAFFQYLVSVQGTLSALVPTQLYDLVSLGKKAPSCLRALIIGGGALSPFLYTKAIELGWPVLPSYGLTECASQVATASLETINTCQGTKEMPDLQLLSHIQAREEGVFLSFFGPSLMTTYAYLRGNDVDFIDPKVKGWLTTEDRGVISYNQVQIFGRGDALVKVGGENVDIARLETILEALCMQLAISSPLAIMALPDSRLGRVVQLVVEGEKSTTLLTLVDQFNRLVLPFERLRGIRYVSKIPRSPLGKVLKHAIPIE